MQIAATVVVGYAVYKRTGADPMKTLIAAVITWVAAGWLLGVSEGFAGFTIGDPMYPYAATELRPIGPSPCNDEGDLVLTNLYRRLHNLDSIQRSEIFQFNDALAGGSYGMSAEQYIGAKYDREMTRVRNMIQRRIAVTRRPYSEMYGTPTKPLFIDTVGDGDDRILGIPSQVGTLPAYY